MRPLLLLAMLFLLYSLPSCNKDDNNNPNAIKELAFSTSSKNSDTTSYAYNSTGQLIKFEDKEDRDSVGINGNQLHYTEYRKTESRTTADATFNLNAQGNVISGHGNFSYSIAAPYTTDFTFTYDSAGHMTNRTDARNDGMTYSYDFIWTNEDMTSIIWKLNGNLYLTVAMDYDLNLLDKMGIGGAQFTMPMNSFIGITNQHLEKHQYTIFAPGPNIQDEYNYIYALDGDGYPSTLMITGIGNPFSDLITYYYL